ncbi:MAG: hypothetical protein IPG90_10210 [Bacteroidetes bacterium]|nr:hypothetical protein [Bacteroidota bacterium]MBK6838592.1 hypothetical protein [Bacteroidota bacterium]MBP6402499.1 hypothetical protein [Bacteroidia bacterium]MBP6648251.1 hypothetical protein [Bacteroidia bacterium]
MVLANRPLTTYLTGKPANRRILRNTRWAAFIELVIFFTVLLFVFTRFL